MTTTKQDIDFVKRMIPTTLLDNAVEWIGENLLPEEVFSKEVLLGWADENDLYPKD